MSAVNGPTPSQALTLVLSKLLKPLVRLLIHYQITYPFTSQLLKSIYLQVATESFPVEGKRITDSRLSLLTGVHRKDVRRLRYEDDPLAVAESKMKSLSAQVIASWLSFPEYSDHEGNAKPLHRLVANGEPSFESLVERVSKQDLRSRSLLDEWMRKKIVSIDNKGMVHLEKEAFLPVENFDDKAYFFGHNLHDHIAASTHNLMGNTPAYFDRSVYYNNLRAESVDELQAFSEQQAMLVIKKINRKAHQLQRKDSGKKGADHRFRFGSYFYSEEQQKMQHKGEKNE